MSINIKKYLWGFFGYFLTGYLIGMGLIFVIDNLLRTNIRDIPLIIVLCITITSVLCHKIIKKENRFLNDEECKKMIAITTLIASAISILPNILYIGYCIFIKITVPVGEIPSLLTQAQLSSDSSVASLLAIPTSYLGIMLFAVMIIYYLMIRLVISLSFKRATRIYKRSHEQGQIPILEKSRL